VDAIGRALADGGLITTPAPFAAPIVCVPEKSAATLIGA
jgi:energy-converting hydrogenase Eha subunit B